MKRSIIFLILLTLVFSCKDESSNPTAPNEETEKVTDYFPLDVGNYWIFETYRADSSLVFSPQQFLDSVYIEKDTLINGKTYKLVKNSSLPVEHAVRDSAEYLVTPTGKKIFTINEGSELLYKEYLPLPDSAYELTWKMKGGDSIFVTPSGQYTAKYAMGSVVNINPKFPIQYERTVFWAYSKNVGLVGRRLTWLFGGDYIEERLIRYKIK